MNRALRILLAMALLGLASCAQQPFRADWIVRNQLWEDSVQTAHFPLWTLSNQAYQYRTGQRLVVLIEGDGKPWLRQHLMAADPTSDDPLLLPLLPEIEVAAVYLGRPCYYQARLAAQGQGVVNDCKPYWWTFGRYSELVVASLVEAVIQLAEDYREVVLVGHSGGGALAVLMAPALAENYQLRVVTLAGNLNVGAWTVAHGYTPLLASLDPMALPPLDTQIEQFHVSGGKDRIIRQAWVESFATRQPNAHFVLEPTFDHRCCWREYAKRLLSDLE